MMSDSQPPSIQVGVIMRREPVSGPMSRWQRFRWVLADVVLPSDLPHWPAPGSASDPLLVEMNGQQDDVSHWLYPGFKVKLHPGPSGDLCYG